MKGIFLKKPTAKQTKSNKKKERPFVARFSFHLRTDNEEKEISLDYPFRSGDEFRFKIWPNRDSYIYVLNVDSTGVFRYVWPEQNELKTANNHIPKCDNKFIHPESFFYFDANTGDDWLIVVLSTERITPRLDFIKYEFDKYKNHPGKAFEYGQAESTKATDSNPFIGEENKSQQVVVKEEDDLPYFNPRLFKKSRNLNLGQIKNRTKDDVGIYAGSNSVNATTLVYPFKLIHVK